MTVTATARPARARCSAKADVDRILEPGSHGDGCAKVTETAAANGDPACRQGCRAGAVGEDGHRIADAGEQRAEESANAARSQNRDAQLQRVHVSPALSFISAAITCETRPRARRRSDRGNRPAPRPHRPGPTRTPASAVHATPHHARLPRTARSLWPRPLAPASSSGAAAVLRPD